MAQKIENLAEAAHYYRVATNTVGLELTLRRAVRLLFDAGIPHSVGGDFALQEHGCLKRTTVAELIVPSTKAASACLQQAGFRPLPGDKDQLRDPDREFFIRLIEAPEPAAVPDISE